MTETEGDTNGPAEEAPEAATAETPAVPDERAANARRRLIRMGVIGAVFAIGAAFVLPNAPRSQRVRIHFGGGSSRVVRATARVGRDGVWDRETTWRFESGAPPSLAWSFELPNGSANVEVEVASAARIASRTVQVELSGGETSVELAPAMSGLE